MLVITLLLFGPIIYLIVSCIVDSVSDKAKEIKRKKYYGEEELIYLTTYNNDNITKDDIMLLFISQLKKYKQYYFNIDYHIIKHKNEQNYAWEIKTIKRTFGWGITYNIRFHFSNGWIYLAFSNKEFNSDGKASLPYYIGGIDFGSVQIEKILNACRDEARIIWKINGMEPTESLPFNYIPLSGSNKTSSGENNTHLDLISFYRNLLGLKLCFSQDELKKSYRDAVSKYHPDKYGTSSPKDRENAEMLMKQVNEAYEILKEKAEIR